MPHFFSKDRLIMAANYMSNALKYTHPEVPFVQIGDDTKEALKKPAEIKKIQKVKAPELSNAPAKAAENKRPAVLEQPIPTSPMQQQYQTR
jgi:hypothetical protein